MATKVEIKICGIRTVEEIKRINDLDVDYIGFVFASSKRQVTPQMAKELIAILNPRIQTVGVFLNEEIERVNEILSFCLLDIVQLHGDETSGYCAKINKPVWKSLSVAVASDIERHKQYPDVSGILLDTFIPGVPGGSGIPFPWEIAKDIPREKIILAGGLSPQNAQKAIEKVGPHVVDISSGVETNGVKDKEKIIEFIRSVRAYG